MGNVRLGAPPELCLELRDKYGIDTFIETGTYKGGTTLWAAEHFENVYTIEAYAKHFHGMVARIARENIGNITPMLGDSREKLPNLLRTIDKPAILWLDAHWCGNYELSAGTPGECSITEELQAVKNSGIRHFILIDDARLFTAPPPMPHDPKQWPSYDKIVTMLPDNYDVTVEEDVIICLPR